MKYALAGLIGLTVLTGCGPASEEAKPTEKLPPILKIPRLTQIIKTT